MTERTVWFIATLGLAFAAAWGGHLLLTVVLCLVAGAVVA